MTLTNVVPYNKRERELSINLNVNKSFTKENCETLIKLRVLEAYPKIYGSRTLNGIKYLRTKLVDMKDIDGDNKYYSQLARFGVNGEYGNIKGDIETNGYSLVELPIMVMELPTGKYIILEGRTRYDILLKSGVTNIPVDIFQKTSKSNALRFAVSMNAQKKPFGKASYVDIRKAIEVLISEGEIQDRPPTPEGKELLRLDIEREIKAMTSQLTENQFNQIVHHGMEIATGVSQVISFPDGTGAQEWLEEHGYMRSENHPYVYVPAGSFKEKLHMRMITALSKNNGHTLFEPGVKEIRFVIFKGVLDSSDPAKSWKKKVRDFGEEFYRYEKELSKVRYHGVEIDNSKVVLFGGIPQVKDLAHKYPMDKIWEYRK